VRRLRVAHIITRLCKGGAQENTVHTVRLANGNRFTIDLISGVTAPNEPSMEDAVRALGIDIIRVPYLVRNPAPLNDLRAYRMLCSILQDGRYDIVHTHTSKAGYLGRLAAAKVGVPIVVHTPHGHIFFGYFNRALTTFYTMLERSAARKSDRLIALTQRGIEEHLAQGVGTRKQWVSIFSGIDLAPYKDAIARRNLTRSNLGLDESAFVIGAVGRLEPVKGFAYFVHAARAIGEAVPNTHFILAGDGALRRELEAEARPLGNRFQFLGMRKDVPDLMSAMDVCVVPSLNEGMGRVIIEAGAAGTPVVASEVGGVPEVVKNEVTGLLVRPKDEIALAAAIRRLIDDAPLRARLSASAREHARAYSLDQMVGQIESLYEDLVREKLSDP